MPAPGCRQRGAIFLSRPERECQIHRVGVDAFAERSHFVDEGNLRGHESSRGFANQFRGRLVGHDHRHTAHDQRVKNLLQHLHGFGRGRSQDQAIGPVEIFDGAAIGEEHRLRDDRGLQSSVFKAFFQRVRSADRSRSHDGQDRRLGGQTRNAHGDIVQSVRFVFGQENHLRLAGKRFDVGGVSQTSRAHIAADDLFQILFEKGDVALGHLDHARAVRMTTGDRSSKIRQAGRNHCSQVPRTVNSDLHGVSPRSDPETRVRSGLWRDRRMLALLFIYSRGRGFSTHGREMYLGPCNDRRE